MNGIIDHIFQFAGTIGIFLMGYYCYWFSRRQNHVLDTKILLFWVALNLGLVTISRLFGQFGSISAVNSRIVSGLISIFIITGFLLYRRNKNGY